MIKIFKSDTKWKWLKLNIATIGLGLVIGLLISSITSAINNQWPTTWGLFFNILFSVIISLCIANGIYIFGLFHRKKRLFGFGFLFFYYGISLLGMFIGVELTYLLASWIFGREYSFFHAADLKFNTIIVLIICTVINIYFSMKDRQETLLKEKELDVMHLNKLRTEAELAALQSKINPHFLYNALNSLASLVSSDPQKAEQMTVKLAALFRYSVNHEHKHLASVAEEMEIVNTYLDIEQIRFGERIAFRKVVDRELEKAKIPRFLIQPLVENALKHGLKDTVKDGILTVSVVRKDNRLEIVVADNGKPFPEELSTGHGLQSTYEKLELLYNKDYQVKLINHPEKLINISIPLET